MTTLAIIGAGPGLGSAVARRFGCEGYDTALISRDQDRHDALAAGLTGEGVTARGFAADVRDPKALTAALDARGHGPGADRGPSAQSGAAADEKKDPAVLADTLWTLHQDRHGFRHFADDLES
ncbi:SDR family NAD(P)-dependent oxidoreductase [Streptomyces sp. NPDC059426]|uniref:SDR family NAD(P)-dependent oxidoreductase n=1 Tax=Streptomyces sp. NPDC059426 TaxID=3346827 RepID=UPI0036B287A7